MHFNLTQENRPHVTPGTEDYPQEILESLTQAVERTIVLQAVKLAEQLGNIRTHNIVLLGVLVKALGLEQLDWVQVMKDLIPEKVLEANVKAFKTGLAV
ncbi:MAG TPA: hypothetical protein DEF42_02705 [Desulfosporosinus sp.]|nr:hypothetical protein [Desulfosporosinus sp.]